MAIKHADFGVPGQGLAVTPFTESGGTAAAFVTDPGEGIGQSARIGSRDTSPPRSARERCTAHVTLGFATLDDLASLEAEPFGAFHIRLAAVAVYPLGHSGAARVLLRSWPVPH
ncbi:hypothetical protein [Streptomyces goshikiensis]|uniref:hypothetical protein n=1 Tax=Streptomyces goshikiensis TaxID=1942 RepID=UPI003653020C